MCGIVGVLGGAFSSLKTVFEQLLYVDALRGPHSTGIAFLNNNYVQVIKDAVSPDELAYYKRYAKAMNKTHLGLLGHNRYKTVGDIKKENAHPFNHGRITLVHNGTLYSKFALFKDKEFETDSEAICASINEWGIDDVWSKIEDQHGAGTICFWDAKAKNFNIISNGNRPLFFSFVKDNEGMVFASEAWMYTGICDRNDIALQYNPKGNCLYYPEKNRLYTFTVGQDRKVSVSSRDIKRPVRQTFNRGNTSYGHYGYDDGWYMRRGNDSYDVANDANDEETESPLVERTMEKGATTAEKAVIALGPVANPQSSKEQENFRSKLNATAFGLAVKEFQDKYKYCVGCEGLLFDEAATCSILDSHNAFCEDCAKSLLPIAFNPLKKLQSSSERKVN